MKCGSKVLALTISSEKEYSGTLDYEHNPKYSHIKASFPIEVNGNENNLFRIDFNSM